MRARATCVGFAAAFLLVPSTSRADDGAYGRLDGDLALAAEAAFTVAGDHNAIGGRLTASYLTMAGVYAQYDHGLGLPDSGPSHRLTGGIDLRPLFLARFVGDLQRGPALVDLWLDSLGVNLGAYAAWREEARDRDPGLRQGLELAGHMALPLLGRASGPLLAVRAGARWDLDVQRGHVESGPQGFAMLSLGYQQLFESGLLTPSPRVP